VRPDRGERQHDADYAYQDAHTAAECIDLVSVPGVNLNLSHGACAR
jgi:hypothetical protein